MCVAPLMAASASLATFARLSETGHKLWNRYRQIETE